MHSEQKTAPALDRAVAVRDGEELDPEALGQYLESEIPELAGEIRVRQFPSGFSNLTYLVSVGKRELVLRRPPFGATIRSAHDMGREYRILSALDGSYPKAPAPVLYCEDPGVLGAPFYLMERVRGVILRPRMKATEAPDSETMAAIAESLVETLAELHRVDAEAVGLSDLGRPAGYVERQVEGWTKRYAGAQTDQIPAVDRTIAWLSENRGSVAGAAGEAGKPGAALIHNDFKYDNLVLDPEDLGRVVAVLDWEMATLGDPMMDLGTSLGYWVDPDDPPEMLALELSPTTLAGNPRRLEVAGTYARLTGRSLEHLVFYYVYGVFKIAVIVQQIYARYKSGHTQDARFASLIEGVKLCGLMAQQAITKGRIDRLFS
ncbi:MAG: phosphotransferase family protein [Thermoanaerobaculia bacterium]